MRRVATIFFKITNISLLFRSFWSFLYTYMSGGPFPASIYLIKVSNENTKTGCEICSKLTIKAVKQWQWCHSGFFVFCYLWTIFTQCSNIFIVEFEQADDNWVICSCITLGTISASLPTVTFKTGVSTSEHLWQRNTLMSWHIVTIKAVENKPGL